MEEIETIAQRSIYKVDKSGDPQLVVIKIGKPRCVDKLWEIHVVLEGISEKTYLIKGVDSFQALCLGLGFIRNVLEKQINEGAKLLWSDKSGEIDLDTMFS